MGGTFTDFTMLDEGRGSVHYFKVPSTPHDPSEAIGAGLSALIADHDIDPALVRHLGHGTTVATNMVIERKGALTGLITTRGFRDTLEIGRQTRPHLYDYSIGRPTPLVPRDLRLEVDERTLSDGTVEVPLDEEQVAEAARKLGEAGVGAVVICFLHSYRRPDHERRAGEIVRAILPDAYVSLSSNVLPESGSMSACPRLCSTPIWARAWAPIWNGCSAGSAISASPASSTPSIRTAA
ncbi:hydantoinase/oxoprolinase N-terminal domain-containing protein [Rhizorhabdus histidinilytica]